MTDTLGLAIGSLMAIALFVYTFWPENAFAASGKRRASTTLKSAKSSSTRICAT